MVRNGDCPDWFQDWRGQIVTIVASGPSAVAADFSGCSRAGRFIAINNSWRLCPWADVLYASDPEWWLRSGVPCEIRGLRVGREGVPGISSVQIAKHPCGQWVDRIVLEPAGTLGSGGCSGFQAINLAVQFGARDIILVGFDASISSGLHWHGAHPDGLENPHEGTAEYWRQCLDDAAMDLDRIGCRIINCSQSSALTAYPKMDVAAAFEHLKKSKAQ